MTGVAIDVLSYNWRALNPSLTVTRKRDGMIVQNDSPEAHYLAAKEWLPTSSRFCSVEYQGVSLEGSGAIFTLHLDHLDPFGESTLNSKAMYRLGYSGGKVIPRIKVMPNTIVKIEKLSLEFFEDEARYGDFIRGYSESETLIVTPNYPITENRYQFGFVHARATVYKEAGLSFDVVASNKWVYGAARYSFDGVDVLRVPLSDLRSFLQKGQYRKIAVHFFDDMFARAFDACALQDTQFYFWCHNADTLFWDFPKFASKYFEQEYKLTEEEIEQFTARNADLARYNSYENVTWIFFSDVLRQESERLLGFSFNRYRIIPNFVNDALFKQKPLNAHDRKKLFVLRRFDNESVYAIDIDVLAIRELSRRPCFKEMEFNIYGTGPFHSTLVKPLEEFENVHIHNRFLSRDEMPRLHAEHGIALFAARFDGHPVSMMEAAMSGLAVVGSKNNSHPQYFPEELLADIEDYKQYADIIERLATDEEFFVESAQACHESACVFGYENTLAKELELLRENVTFPVRKKPPASPHPVLTIVIPSYNAAQTLEYTVRTIMRIENAAQLELLIVDDGSKDTTAEVACALMEEYNDVEAPIIQLIQKENGGHGSTINAGLTHARGKYFRVVDSDDWVASDDLQKLVTILEQEESSIVITDYSEDDINEPLLEKDILYDSLKPGHTYDFDDLCFGGYGFKLWGPIMATSSYKTQMLRDIGMHLTEKTFYTDQELNMYAILGPETLAYYPLDVYRYYLGRKGQSISRASMIRNRHHHFAILKGIIDYLNARPEIPAVRRHCVMEKVVKPLAMTHYMICVEWMRSRRRFLELERLICPYPDIYNDEEKAPRYIQLHRKTKGFTVPFDALILKLVKIRNILREKQEE